MSCYFLADLLMWNILDKLERRRVKSCLAVCMCGLQEIRIELAEICLHIHYDPYYSVQSSIVLELFFLSVSSFHQGQRGTQSYACSRCCVLLNKGFPPHSVCSIALPHLAQAGAKRQIALPFSSGLRQRWGGGPTHRKPVLPGLASSIGVSWVWWWAEVQLVRGSNMNW